MKHDTATGAAAVHRLPTPDDAIPARPASAAASAEPRSDQPSARLRRASGGESEGTNVKDRRPGKHLAPRGARAPPELFGAGDRACIVQTIANRREEIACHPCAEMARKP
jgi:hypothetical protein